MQSNSRRAPGTIARVTLLGLAVSGFAAVAIPALAEEMGWNNDSWGGSTAMTTYDLEQQNMNEPDVVVDQAILPAINSSPEVDSFSPAVEASSPQDVWGSVTAIDPGEPTSSVCINNSDCADDGNVCTSEICSGGRCFSPYNTFPCDDGDVCTSEDQCQIGSCVGQKNICLGAIPTRRSMPTQRPAISPRSSCSEGSRMCSFGTIGDVCVENDKCCSNSDCSVTGSYCSFFLTCDCSVGEHVCASINTCSAGNCCPGDTCAPGQSCDDGNSCTRDVCVQQPNGTSTPYYLWENQPIPGCGGCVENVGQPCTSTPNLCGQMADGTIQCSGACSATTPPITGMHLSCALGQCILFPNIPGQCTDVDGCKGKKVGNAC